MADKIHSEREVLPQHCGETGVHKKGLRYGQRFQRRQRYTRKCGVRGSKEAAAPLGKSEAGGTETESDVVPGKQDRAREEGLSVHRRPPSHPPGSE